MKSLAPGIFSLLFASYIYTQTFNVSMGLGQQMESLMNGAATQLSEFALSAPNSTSQTF